MIVIEGSPSSLEEVRKIAAVENVTASKIRPIDPVSTAIDSPLGGQEVKVLAETIILYFQVGTGALKFLLALLTLVKATKEVLVLRDKAGAQVGEIKPDTTPRELEKIAAKIGQ